jgi:nitroreductase
MMPSFETEIQSKTLSQSSLINLIKARRASKDFVSNQSISRKDLEEILYAGSLAPSGFNLQPWRFIIVETPEGKDKLYDCAFEQEQIKQASTMIICCGERQVFVPDYIENVLKLGLDLGSMNEKHAQFLRQTIPTFHKFHPSFEAVEAWINRQVMIAVTQMMLVGKSLNIDSCPMEGFVTAAIKEAFALPATWDVCCLLALGYAKQERQFGGRFNLDKICFQEKIDEPSIL